MDQHVGPLQTVVRRICSTGFVFVDARTKFIPIESSLSQSLFQESKEDHFHPVDPRIDTRDVTAFDESNDRAIAQLNVILRNRTTKFSRQPMEAVAFSETRFLRRSLVQLNEERNLFTDPVQRRVSVLRSSDCTAFGEKIFERGNVTAGRAVMRSIALQRIQFIDRRTNDEDRLVEKMSGETRWRMKRRGEKDRDKSNDRCEEMFIHFHLALENPHRERREVRSSSMNPIDKRKRPECGDFLFVRSFTVLGSSSNNNRATTRIGTFILQQIFQAFDRSVCRSERRRTIRMTKRERSYLNEEDCSLDRLEWPKAFSIESFLE